MQNGKSIAVRQCYSASERSVATDEICVKGFGMFPNKSLQTAAMPHLQNARVGTAVHCLLGLLRVFVVDSNEQSAKLDQKCKACETMLEKV